MCCQSSGFLWLLRSNPRSYSMKSEMMGREGDVTLVCRTMFGLHGGQPRNTLSRGWVFWHGLRIAAASDMMSSVGRISRPRPGLDSIWYGRHASSYMVYWSSSLSRRIHPHICHIYDWSHFRFLPHRNQFLDSSADPRASPGGRQRTWQAPPWPQRTCRSSPRPSPILFIISCLNCDPREKVLRPHLLAQLAARNKSVILEGRISS